MERYRPLFFDGILGYPNPIPADLREKMNKFVGNNVVTTEEHLKYFMDMLNDYDVEHEYVVMKLFIQSLVEYARDWYRGLPNASISSWDEFEMCLEE